MENLWQIIYNSFKENPRDVKTSPSGNRKAKWFYVYTQDGEVYIEKAKFHLPVCNISKRRKLDKIAIKYMFDFYKNRDCKKRSEIVNVTHNSSYWLGIFEDLKI